MAKVALWFTKAEMAAAQAHRYSPPIWQLQKYWQTNKPDPALLVYAVRPPYHHMRWRRWQLHMNARYEKHERLCDTGYDRFVPLVWEPYRIIPPNITEMAHGDDWYFRDQRFRACSAGYRQASGNKTIDRTYGYLEVIGHERLYEFYHSPPCPEPLLIKPAPSAQHYRGMVVRPPLKSLLEAARHHVRRLARYRKHGHPQGSPWSPIYGTWDW